MVNIGGLDEHKIHSAISQGENFIFNDFGALTVTELVFSLFTMAVCQYCAMHLINVHLKHLSSSLHVAPIT